MRFNSDVGQWAAEAIIGLGAYLVPHRCPHNAPLCARTACLRWRLAHQKIVWYQGPWVTPLCFFGKPLPNRNIAGLTMLFVVVALTFPSVWSGGS